MNSPDTKHRSFASFYRFTPPWKDETESNTGLAYLKSGLYFRVFALWRGGRRREEIGEERQEQGHVLSDELAEVHVSEGPVHEEGLRLVGVVALRFSRRSQHLVHVFHLFATPVRT